MCVPVILRWSRMGSRACRIPRAQCPVWLPVQPQPNCLLVVYRCTRSHSFPDSLLVVYRCTRTRSPHPPPWPCHSVPFSAQREHLLGIELSVGTTSRQVQYEQTVRDERWPRPCSVYRCTMSKQRGRLAAGNSPTCSLALSRVRFLYRLRSTMPPARVLSPQLEPFSPAPTQIITPGA
jgi:hypothetical protein